MKKQFIRKNYDAKEMMNFDSIVEYLCNCTVNCSCACACTCNCSSVAGGSVEQTAETKSSPSLSIGNTTRTNNSYQMSTSMAV